MNTAIRRAGQLVLPCEQMLLSCMAFSIDEVIRVACLLRTVVGFCLQKFLTGSKQTKYTTDKPRK